jgi:hypothetical protein
MTKWKVTTAGTSAVEIEAHRAVVTPAGVLLLSENSGPLIRAFAPGAWQECELVERGAQGYFPK